MAEVKQNLIDRRKALGVTQSAVAVKVGISRSSYSAIERGLRDPSLDTAQRICLALDDMPINEAFPIKEKP